MLVFPPFEPTVPPALTPEMQRRTAQPPARNRASLLSRLLNPFQFQRGSLLMFGNALAMGALGVSLLSLYAQANLAPETALATQGAQANLAPVNLSLPAFLKNSSEADLKALPPSERPPNTDFTALLAPTPPTPATVKRLQEATEEEENAALEKLFDKVQKGLKPTKAGAGTALASRHLPPPTLNRVRGSVQGLMKPLHDLMVSSPFGWRSGRLHTGIDYAAPTGAPILSSGNGTVTFSGWQSGYGYLVIIDHGHGLTTRYAHCSKLLVSIGQAVQPSQRIALVGDTGHATGPHLHYEVLSNGIAQNPERYLALR